MYLELKNVTVFYDRAMLLNNVSIGVDVGELVSVVGPNGAGKTTLLRTIAGLVKWEREILRGTRAGRITIEGSVKFCGEEMTGLPPYEIVRRGLTLCPERGRPFREMTVIENLRAPTFLVKDKQLRKKTLEMVYILFPILKERENQVAGTLSGGERTMLAISRALMSGAKLLLVDEPSTGLSPKLKGDLFERLKQIHSEGGITILLVEQDVSYAFGIASRNYVISKGSIVAEGTVQEILADELLRKTYLGL